MRQAVVTIHHQWHAAFRPGVADRSALAGDTSLLVLLDFRRSTAQGYHYRCFAAPVLRIALRWSAQLLQIIGPIFIGGLLFVWVAWRCGANCVILASRRPPEIEGDESSGLRSGQSFQVWLKVAAIADAAGAR
jgi:hypothetical protein